MKVGKYLTLKNEVTMESSSGIDNIAIKAEVTLLPFESVIVAENMRFSEIVGTRTKDTLDIKFKSQEGTCIIKFFLPNNTITEVANVASTLFNAVKNGNPTEAIKEISYPKVYDENNQLIGTFDYYLVDLGDPSQNYPGFKFTYRGIVYTLFEVPSNFDAKPALCIYENDNKLVGEVIYDYPKYGTIHSDLPKYDIYVEDNQYFNVVSILTTIWHQMRDNTTKINTNLVHLKERYHADFINNIRSNCNPNNLPENMTLVKELYKSAKFSKRRILPIIIGLVIALAMIIYMLIDFLSK